MEFCVKNRRLMLIIDGHLIIRFLIVNLALQKLHLGRKDLDIRNEPSYLDINLNFVKEAMSIVHDSSSNISAT